MKLGEIIHVKVSKLKPNEHNQRFFKIETGSYFKQLSEDIEKRGIQVPLIAKKDGTLLAGHNRLKVAKSLGIEEVPVQYLSGKITEKVELEYIIKDNLLRRHLSPEERRSLYTQIHKDLEDRLMIKNNSVMGVIIKNISEQTGINPTTVNYDITKMRRAKQKELNEQSAVQVTNEKAISAFKKAVGAMLNVAIIDNIETIEVFNGLLVLASEKIQSLKEMRNAKETVRK